jgi:NAD+ kinase
VKRDAKRATRPPLRPRVVVVAKRTAYHRFVEEERDPRAKALLRRRDPAVAHWLDAHRDHARTLESVLRELERAGAQVMLVERAHAAFDASDAALVVAVGGDGTLLAASHSVVRVPILGVNSAPRYSVGFFCSAQRATFRGMLEQALLGKLPSVELTRMAVAVNGRLRTKHVLNEVLYCHSSPAATSRYLLSYGGLTEEQRSSGIWVGPAAGSTAAQRSAGGRVLPLHSRLLQLVVREPYNPSGKKYRLPKLTVADGDAVGVESKMDDSALFFDGPYRPVPVRLGDSVSFFASDEPLNVLGLGGRARR